MKIQKFEQSGFILESSSGFRLAIDIAGLTPIETIKGVTVDAMLVSHVHGDHFSLTHIRALSPKTLYTGTECIGELPSDFNISSHEITDGDQITVGDFSVSVFSVDHGPNAPRIPEQNFGFLVTDDTDSFYFAGDMYYPPKTDLSDTKIEILAVPVGGHYTFDHVAALEFAGRFANIGQYIIPMHYESVPHIDTNAGRDFQQIAQDQFEIRTLTN